MNLKDTIYDCLIDNDDTFLTIDEIYTKLNNNKVYNPKKQKIYFQDVLKECKDIESIFEDVYSFYIGEQNYLVQFLIYTQNTENKVNFKSYLYDKLMEIYYKDSSKNIKYDIYEDKKEYEDTYYENFIDTVLKKDKDIYNSDNLVNYLLTETNKPLLHNDYLISKLTKKKILTLEDLNKLISYFAKEKETVLELYYCKKKIELLEAQIEYYKNNPTMYFNKKDLNYKKTSQKYKFGYPSVSSKNLWTYLTSTITAVSILSAPFVYYHMSHDNKDDL